MALLRRRAGRRRGCDGSRARVRRREPKGPRRAARLDRRAHRRASLERRACDGAERRCGAPKRLGGLARPRPSRRDDRDRVPALLPRVPDRDLPGRGGIPAAHRFRFAGALPLGGRPLSPSRPRRPAGECRGRRAGAERSGGRLLAPGLGPFPGARRALLGRGVGSSSGACRDLSRPGGAGAGRRGAPPPARRPRELRALARGGGSLRASPRRAGRCARRWNRWRSLVARRILGADQPRAIERLALVLAGAPGGPPIPAEPKSGTPSPRSAIAPGTYGLAGRRGTAPASLPRRPPASSPAR